MTTESGADESRTAIPVEPAGVEILLSPFQRFHTRSPDRAEEETAQLLSPHRLRLAGRADDFDAEVSFVGLGSTSLYLMRYGAEITINRAPQSEYMTVLIPLTGAIEARHQGLEFIASQENATQVVLSEDDSVHMRWSADCSVISLRADLDALRTVLSTMLPDSTIGSLRFDPMVDSPTGRAAITGVVHLLTSSLPAAASGLPATTARHLREHALTTVLLGLRHNYTKVSTIRRGAKVDARVLADLDLGP